MTRSLLLVSLAAGALTVPAPASSAATELAIREITVRPAAPVVGAGNSVRLVIDVVAKGVRGRDGVTVSVEPGAPPAGAERPSPPGPPHVLAPEADAAGGRPDTGAMPPADPGTPPATDTGGSGAEGAGSGADVIRSGADVVRSAAEAVRSAAGALRPEGGAQGSGAGRAEAGAEGAPEVPGRLVWRLAPSPLLVSDGWQTWRFLPDKELTRFYPAGTWTIAATAKGPNGTSVTAYESFQLKRETRLTEVEVERARHAEGVRLHGSLKRVDGRGLTGFAPFGRQRVEILWRESPSAEWSHTAYATTDAKGSFTHTVRDRAGGYWRVRYEGTGRYAPDLSKSHQITG
ncbi:hypothetical protein [Nonomuraea sp. SBT364]|uniref:hypothetical protein n=1 Tax=Nonomuraea sp. SBT364 TaxID=1580530 RepID=UPI00066E8B8B|nr:hypothetical protein [Nonomuraea sp. SBT364]